MPQIRDFISYLKSTLYGIQCEQCKLREKTIAQMTEAMNTLMENIESMYEDFRKMEQHYNNILNENRELKEREYTDSLTQLLNREGIDNAFHRVAANIQRTVKRMSANAHTPEISVLFVDIDKFKEINDANGHDVGDKVLIIIADMMKSSFRPGDIPGRIGGDEFLVILPNANVAEAKIVAEKFRGKVEHHHLLQMLGVQTTVSIGVAEAYLDRYTADLALVDAKARADAAMYVAKIGRNLVCVADPKQRLLS